MLVGDCDHRMEADIGSTISLITINDVKNKLIYVAPRDNVEFR